MKTPRILAKKRFLALLFGGWMASASGFSVHIAQTAPAQLYLQVGDGVYTGTFTGGGTPGSGGAINTVSVTVPLALVGNGVAQAMTTNTTQSTTPYDGSAACNAGTQLYVGGFETDNPANGDGSLSVTTPANLTSGGGQVIPFSQISWISSDPTVIASGAFTGGAQALGAFKKDTWRESCLSFSYANTLVKLSGVYTGRATYTLVEL